MQGVAPRLERCECRHRRRQRFLAGDCWPAIPARPTPHDED